MSPSLGGRGSRYFVRSLVRLLDIQAELKIANDYDDKAGAQKVARAKVICLLGRDCLLEVIASWRIGGRC